MSRSATIDGRTVTLKGETRRGTPAGPFLVHRGFDYMRGKWTVTTPNGSCLGYYPSRRLAADAAAAIAAAVPDLDWHGMTPESELPRETAQDLLAISLRFAR